MSDGSDESNPTRDDLIEEQTVLIAQQSRIIAAMKRENDLLIERITSANATVNAAKKAVSDAGESVKAIVATLENTEEVAVTLAAAILHISDTGAESSDDDAMRVIVGACERSIEQNFSLTPEDRVRRMELLRGFLVGSENRAEVTEAANVPSPTAAKPSKTLH